MHLSFRTLYVSRTGCQLMALAVAVVIAIDKPQKRKAYKVQSALLLSFSTPYTKVNLPNRSCTQTHNVHHPESPNAWHGMAQHGTAHLTCKLLSLALCVCAVLFYFGSNQKIHCCHSKCLSLCFFAVNVLKCLLTFFHVSFQTTERDTEKVKCFYRFLSSFHRSIKIIYRSMLSLSLGQFTLIFIRFYCYHFGNARFPLLLLPLSLFMLFMPPK